MFQYFRFIFLFLCVLFSTAAFIPNQITLKGCATGTEDFPSSQEAYEWEILGLTNEIRMKRNLRPLKMQNDLRRAARYHATDMSQDRYMSHDTHDRNTRGKLVRVCDIWSRMEGFYTHNFAAENVAEGYPTPKMVVDAWMNSKGHRKNILNPNYRALGVGYAKTATARSLPYWAQSFGARHNVYHLLINLDAPSTATHKVNLYIQGDWQQMRISNGGYKWTEWMPFKQRTNWVLENSTEQQQKSVRVEVRNKEGATYQMEDSILVKSPS